MSNDTKTDDTKLKEKDEVPLLLDSDPEEVLGLVELIKSKGGREDIYKLAQELSMEFGDTLSVIRGAELLGFVHTPGGDVEIQPLGKELLKAKVSERKAIVCKQLEKLEVFSKIEDFLRSIEDHEVSKDEVLEKIAELIPNNNVEQSFSNIVQWGRYGELFGYNDDTQTFYLDDEDETEEEID